MTEIGCAEVNFRDDDGDTLAARFFSLARKIFGGVKIFEKLDRIDANDFVQKSLKSELSSRFLSQFHLGRTECPT